MVRRFTVAAGLTAEAGPACAANPEPGSAALAPSASALSKVRSLVMTRIAITSEPQRRPEADRKIRRGKVRQAGLDFRVLDLRPDPDIVDELRVQNDTVALLPVAADRQRIDDRVGGNVVGPAVAQGRRDHELMRGPERRKRELEGKRHIQRVAPVAVVIEDRAVLVVAGARHPMQSRREDEIGRNRRRQERSGLLARGWIIQRVGEATVTALDVAFDLT